MIAEQYDIVLYKNLASIRITELALKIVDNREKGRENSSVARTIINLKTRKDLLAETDPVGGSLVLSDEGRAEITSQMIQIGKLREVALRPASVLNTLYQTIEASSRGTAVWGKITGVITSQQDLIDYIASQIGIQNPIYSPGVGAFVQVGGLKVGDIPEGTMEGLFNQMIYPFQVPALSALIIQGESTLREVGDSLVAMSYIMQWAVTNPANIESAADSGNLTVDDATLLGNITGFGDFDLFGVTTKGWTLGVAFAETNPATTIFTLSGKDSNSSALVPTTFTLNWGVKVYWGSRNDLDVLVTEVDVKNLASNQIRTSRQTTYGMAGGGFSFIAIPQDIAQAGIQFTDPSTGFVYDMTTQDTFGGVATIDVTNTFGVIDTYTIYRSSFQIGSATNLRVT